MRSLELRLGYEGRCSMAGTIAIPSCTPGLMMPRDSFAGWGSSCLKGESAGFLLLYRTGEGDFSGSVLFVQKQHLAGHRDSRACYCPDETCKVC